MRIVGCRQTPASSPPVSNKVQAGHHPAAMPRIRAIRLRQRFWARPVPWPVPWPVRDRCRPAWLTRTKHGRSAVPFLRPSSTACGSPVPGSSRRHRQTTSAGPGRGSTPALIATRNGGSAGARCLGPWPASSSVDATRLITHRENHDPWCRTEGTILLRHHYDDRHQRLGRPCRCAGRRSRLQTDPVS